MVRTLVFGWRTFPCPVPDLWLTRDHFVGKLFPMGQPTRSTSRLISRNPRNCMDYVGGDHYAADWGRVWLDDRSVQSPRVRVSAAA